MRSPPLQGPPASSEPERDPVEEAATAIYVDVSVRLQRARHLLSSIAQTTRERGWQAKLRCDARVQNRLSIGLQALSKAGSQVYNAEEWGFWNRRQRRRISASLDKAVEHVVELGLARALPRHWPAARADEPVGVRGFRLWGRDVPDYDGREPETSIGRSVSVRKRERGEKGEKARKPRKKKRQQKRKAGRSPSTSSRSSSSPSSSSSDSSDYPDDSSSVADVASSDSDDEEIRPSKRNIIITREFSPQTVTA